MRAKVYRPGMASHDFRVNEKFDGIRGRWDGCPLLTRGGQVVAAPHWFTAGWPAVALDGEWWVGRGKFEHTVFVVRQQQAGEAAWRNIRFMIFVLPGHAGVFTERSQAATALVAQIGQTRTQAVPQEPSTTHADLMQRMAQAVRAGGDGLMLHRGSAHCQHERSGDLLKLKTHDDAGARVGGHEAGKGLHAGRVGALLVVGPDGRH